MFLRSGKFIISSPQPPPKQIGQKADGPEVITLVAPRTTPRGVGSQSMQDAMSQSLANSAGSSSNNA